MKLGIISFAHMHAASYAQCISTMPGVELTAIYDDDHARGAEMAKRFECHVEAELDGFFAHDLAGVVICSENARHRYFVEQAATRVGHILCEKPIATSLADAQAMIDHCQQTNTRLQIAFPVRFSPPVQQLKRQLETAALGQVISVTCTNHGRMPGGWFVDPQLAGGGAVLDHSVHVIDILRWLWNTEVSEVYAEVGVSLLHQDVGIDDAGLIFFKLRNGVFGSLDTSWSRPESYPTWGDVKLDVLTQHASLRVNAFRQQLQLSSNLNQRTDYLHWGSNADRGLMQDFVAMIRSGREPSITGYDGLKALEVALAAYQSGDSGQVVKLA